jgi:hypothetical protein
LTISELAVEFRDYIGKYHHKAHSETKQTPLEFWAEHCFAVPADPGQVGLLLQMLEHRAISKGFIQYGSRRYWHDDLWKIPADAEVQIRAQPKDMRPDDIEVIYEGKRYCTAFALDSDAGRKVDGKRVLTAQRRQRNAIQQYIDEKRAVLHHAEREIEEQMQETQQDAADEQADTQEQRSPKKSPARSHKKRSSAAPIPSRRTTMGSGFSGTTKQEQTAWDHALASKERREQQQQRKRMS